VTDPDLLAEVAALLKGITEVAIDLETTRLDPRKDSIRLLAIATKAGTYIVDCQSVDPAGVFPVLAGITVVADNALFDLSFLSYFGVRNRQCSRHHDPIPVASCGLESGALEEGTNLP
jgi:ribonuclease D